MSTGRKGLRESLRIIWTIASKDIVDAMKNKTILANIVCVFLMLLAYKWLPNLYKKDGTFLVVYDVGDSSLVSELDDHPQFNPLRATSMQALEGYMDDLDVWGIGLVIPEDYDQIVDSGGQPVLDGYSAWSTRSAVETLRSDYEQQLSDLAGYPVGIDIKGTIYPPPDSMGPIRWTSISFVITIFFMGNLVVPHLMFEEKQTKTLDALLVSPASIGQIVLGKATAGLFYVLIGAVAAFVLHLNVVVHWALAILAVFGGTLFSVGIALLLGIMLKTRQQMMLWSFAIFQPLLIPVFLSGMEPILPAALKAALPWVPSVALATLFRYSFSNGAALSQILTSLTVVLGSGVLILALVVWKVRQLDR